MKAERQERQKAAGNVNVWRFWEGVFKGQGGGWGWLGSVRVFFVGRLLGWKRVSLGWKRVSFSLFDA